MTAVSVIAFTASTSWTVPSFWSMTTRFLILVPYIIHSWGSQIPPTQHFATLKKVKKSGLLINTRATLVLKSVRRKTLRRTLIQKGLDIHPRLHQRKIDGFDPSQPKCSDSFSAASSCGRTLCAVSSSPASISRKTLARRFSSSASCFWSLAYHRQTHTPVFEQRTLVKPTI